MVTVPNAREMRGMEMARAISDKPDVAIQRLNKLTYKVKSQSDASKFYTVIKQYSKTYGDNMRDGKWTCDCPDHTFRNVICKHIHAVLFSKLLRKKVYQDNLIQTPINQNIIDANKVGKIVCQRCGSENHKKWGVRHNKKAGDIQTYLCQDCSYRFTFNPAFENAKASARTISNAIDLYFKGVSLRKIAEHLQSQGTEINYSSICRWIRKFNQTVQPYVDSFVPAQVGGVYHVDEMLLHVRKEDNDMNMTLENKENHTNRKFDNHYSWLWNLMDSTTRFWICSRITQKRSANDARAVFAEMKQRAPLPKAIVHDGLFSYNEAYMKELYSLKSPRIQNIRSIGSNENSLNPKVERLNGTVRDRETVMRGLDNPEAAQELVDAMRIHYNFIRVNQAIGQTPAQAAGINLNLGENKVESLMRQAAVYGKEVQQEPIVKGLGIRANKVQVLNESDCIKVKPRTWLDKKDWREIHDILRVQGFNWLANGKDSCWIRMTV
ncbi:MAG: DDE-type integrase/transposase/recombinase [Nitrososphaera sp.]|jgi:transposase-like protein